MISVITWYDVLGVLPDAPPEDIRAAWQAADRARQQVDQGWDVLADPAARAAYDQEIGFARPGEGLAPPGRGPSGPHRESTVTVQVWHPSEPGGS